MHVSRSIAIVHTDSKVLRTLFEQWIDNLFRLNLLDCQWSWGNLLANWLLLWAGLKSMNKSLESKKDSAINFYFQFKSAMLIDYTLRHEPHVVHMSYIVVTANNCSYCDRIQYVFTNQM